MPIEQKFERVEPDSPYRCQGMAKHTQCPYKALEGSTYCAMHGGVQAQRRIAEKINRQYNLAKWQARVEKFSDHDHVKSLRDEIGIARLLLEETVTQCKDTTDLLLFSGKIGDLVTRIEKLVTSCHRLEGSMGMMIDKSAALHLAGQIVEIIAEEISDELIVDRIGSKIALAIANLNKDST